LANNIQVKRLRESVRMLVRRLGILERSEASCCGITFAQCHVLVELGRSEKLSVNDLAEILRLDKSTVSRSVDNLVNTGLVLREPDPEDRRYVTLRLSEKGGVVFADLERRMESYFADIVDMLPEGKREQVLESLLLLADAVKNPRCCDLGTDNNCAIKER
jgi:DNA-binding MarR family transcriptional regulator